MPTDFVSIQFATCPDYQPHITAPNFIRKLEQLSDFNLETRILAITADRERQWQDQNQIVLAQAAFINYEAVMELRPDIIAERKRRELEEQKKQLSTVELVWATIWTVASLLLVLFQSVHGTMHNIKTNHECYAASAYLEPVQVDENGNSIGTVSGLISVTTRYRILIALFVIANIFVVTDLLMRRFFTFKRGFLLYFSKFVSYATYLQLFMFIPLVQLRLSFKG